MEKHGFFHKANGEVIVPPDNYFHHVVGLRKQYSSFEKDPDGTAYVSDDAVFGAMGFTNVKSLDICYYEDADYIFDLNQADIKQHVELNFDLVIDGGTMEHIFHVPNCFQNIFDVLKVGGCVLHLSPANNHLDHGFYQFCPTLFYDYYASNNYSVLDAKIFSFWPNDEQWEWKPYQPHSLDAVNMGGLDAKIYGTAILARKQSHSTYDVIPQQSYYADMTGWRSMTPTLSGYWPEKLRRNIASLRSNPRQRLSALSKRVLGRLKR
jgi:hypothetical protein